MKKLFLSFFLLPLAFNAQIIDAIAGGGVIPTSVPSTSVELGQPSGITLDANGNIYFTDPAFGLVRRISSSGIITSYAGTGVPGTYLGNGGQATQARVQGPIGIARDAAGNVYFADSKNQYVHKISPSGIISIYAGNGTSGYSGDGGMANACQLKDPMGICVDATGNVYVADNLNHAIRKISTSGIITTVAGNGTPGFSGDGGLATNAKLNSPFGVSVNAAGEIFIADSYNYRIRKVDGSGNISTYAGNGFPFSTGDGGPATAAGLIPVGMYPDGAGNLYFADYAGNKIRKINSSGIITTVAGNGTAGFSGDGGPATSAMLSFPRQVFGNSAGDIFFCDGDNNRIRKVSSNGTITTIAGKASSLTQYATAMRIEPSNIHINKFDGTILFADRFGYAVHKIDLSTGNTKRIAGNGIRGFSGDGGLATNAKLDSIEGIFSDTSGIYIVDMGNARIRKVNKYGIISTIAGNGTIGFSGDGGPATSASMKRPTAITKIGNTLFFSDMFNFRIRKINLTTGIISTYMGDGIPGNTGNGGPVSSARVGLVNSMDADNLDNIYFADVQYNVVRKINTSNVVSAFAGNGSQGYSGDNGPAVNATLYDPYGVACDYIGNVYITDYQNLRIRKVNAGGIISTICGNGNNLYAGDGGSANLATITWANGISSDKTGNSIVFSNTKIRMISNLVTPDICIVSTDSLSNFNEIAWEKTNYFNVDSFIVYREVSSNPSVFAKIGAVPASAYSAFVDTTRSFFTANQMPNGNPKVSTYRYKIKIRDLDNNFSFYSKYHNSVYINDLQNGSFQWNLYDIENTSSPVTNYKLYRDTLNNGNWFLVGTTSGAQTLLVDPKYSTYQAYANWRVDAIGFNCNPTARPSAEAASLVKKSKSNISSNRPPVGIVKHNKTSYFTVYPIPAIDYIVLDPQIEKLNYSVKFLTVLGFEIKTFEQLSGVSQLNISDLNPGVYMLQLFSENKLQFTRKIIKQ